MKFTNLTSAALAGATVLSILAPAAVSHAATPNNDADANAGTALPQTDTTEAGISFGNPGPNPNTGYLRLQKVPSILDFGNHVQFNSAYPKFSADGKNTGNSSNDRFASYKEKDTNLTPLLVNNAKGLEKIQDMAWATVVDKQSTRTTKEDKDNGLTNKAGDWSLYVKANSSLNRIDTDGNVMPDGDVTDANLTFKNTNSAQTQAVFDLTGETQDKDYKADAAAKPVGGVTSTVNVPLTTTTDNGSLVAKAADGEGSGADVFAWNPADINLSLPASATVQSPATYQAKLTWTLSSDAASSPAA